MLFYKNVINDEVVGLTTSPYTLNVENFFEVTKEEYIELGGYIEPEVEVDTTGTTDQETSTSSLSKALIDALVD